MLGRVIVTTRAYFHRIRARRSRCVQHFHLYTLQEVYCTQLYFFTRSSLFERLTTDDSSTGNIFQPLLKTFPPSRPGTSRSFSVRSFSFLFFFFTYSFSPSSYTRHEPPQGLPSIRVLTCCDVPNLFFLLFSPFSPLFKPFPHQREKKSKKGSRPPLAAHLARTLEPNEGRLPSQPSWRGRRFPLQRRNVLLFLIFLFFIFLVQPRKI